MSDMTNRPLRLILDGKALTRNWQALDRLSGPATACGAAIKANGYGFGAVEVVSRLYDAGCRDFFVATWHEAAELEEAVKGASLSVLNGVLPDDLPLATQLKAKPVLNSLTQIALWRETEQPCDLMVNSGMNRLGLNPAELRTCDWSALEIDILASHLASAEEDTEQTAQQLRFFRTVIDHVPHRRTSLANSAGIALGQDFTFDLTRPGLAIYGGITRAEFAAVIATVGTIESQLLQIRDLEPGDRVGYNATYRVDTPMRAGIISAGYADGYLRSFSNTGVFLDGERNLPVIGRVSMDLVILDLTESPDLREGDWVSLPLDLPLLSQQSGLSQYEILTGLGDRFDRIWRD